MTEREKFEAWFKRDFHPDITGPYVKNQLLFAWQAATASTQEQMAALAAECESHKKALATILEHCPVNHPHIDAACAAMIAHDNLYCYQTPATDAFIADQQAIGVEKFAQYWEGNCRHNDTFVGGEANNFAQQLRDEVKS